jgi:hypothetical protein
MQLISLHYIKFDIFELLQSKMIFYFCLESKCVYCINLSSQIYVIVIMEFVCLFCKSGTLIISLLLYLTPISAY